jgi:hypothetical protein
MISDGFRKEIKEFFDYLDGNNFGVKYKYDEKIAYRILTYYLPRAQAQPETIKRQCFEIMKTSCFSNEDHRHLKEWKGALWNILLFCILPTLSFHEIEAELKRPFDSLKGRAISSIVRFSRWYHTDTSFWKRFYSPARDIGKLLWGDMERLNECNP